ncbi:MAG TPA: hypothetical protein DCM40_07280, partial [Maribacter sp.]|nr:hypothetical protein [Maribacter sp.]
ATDDIDEPGTANLNDYNYGGDYLYDAWGDYNFYTINIKMADYSKNIMTNLIKTYEKMMTDYTDYYDAARDECSYNKTDDKLNKFFIDGIMSDFSDLPFEAPWYRAPVVYHTHLDMLSNIYDGNKDMIMAAALIDAERLLPANARLRELEGFFVKIKGLRDFYYVPGTDFYVNYDDTKFFLTKEFGGHPDGDSQDGYHAMLAGLPKPVNVDLLGYSSKTGNVVIVDTEDLE